MQRLLNISISIPLGDKASAAFLAHELESLVRREWREEEVFVSSFHVGIPIGEPASLVKNMVKELQDSGLIPKKEPWEEKDDGEGKET